MYSYSCECGNTVDILQPNFNPPNVIFNCICGKKFKRDYGSFTIIYKGAGFATTDARGITGHKRRPKIKTGYVGDLPPADQERARDIMEGH